jgi:hypothetical protein
MNNQEEIIIGQEAMTSYGLGRITAVGPLYNCGGVIDYKWIGVTPYVIGYQMEFAPHNVELLNPRNNTVFNSIARSGLGARAKDFLND